MAQRIEVYAGTAGHSVWFSQDLGEHFIHPNSHSGLYLEARTWCFSSHPQNLDDLYAGTDMGIFIWQESTARWKFLKSPMTDVWAIAQDPSHPEIIYAGARPAQMFRSKNAGKSWEHMKIEGLATFSEINMGPTRFTQILFDPVDEDTIWATVEIGGIFLSTDRGNTWQAKINGLESIDVHGIWITKKDSGEKIIYATTNRGLHRSLNNGALWEFVLLDSPWQYTRAITGQVNTPSTIWLCNGNGPPGDTGKLLKSEDYGYTWSEVLLPVPLKSTPWCIATHYSDPNLIFLCSNLGQVFKSSDQGLHWTKLAHEFGELRALHWRTTNYEDNRPSHSVTVRLLPKNLSLSS